jgi:hypothetical protein
MIRTTNNVFRTLIFQAKLPPPIWAKAINTTDHLLNIRPSRVIANFTPYFLLYSVHPTYDHLRTFGWLCFPNLSHSIDHKLSPCSTRCILLGYPREHKGYMCFDLSSRKIIITSCRFRQKFLYALQRLSTTPTEHLHRKSPSDSVG